MVRIRRIHWHLSRENKTACGVAAYRTDVTGEFDTADNRRIKCSDDPQKVTCANCQWVTKIAAYTKAAPEINRARYVTAYPCLKCGAYGPTNHDPDCPDAQTRPSKMSPGVAEAMTRFEDALSQRRSYERLVRAFTELQNAAQKVIDATDANFDNEQVPVKFGVAFGPITALRLLLAKQRGLR